MSSEQSTHFLINKTEYEIITELKELANKFYPMEVEYTSPNDKIEKYATFLKTITSIQYHLDQSKDIFTITIHLHPNVYTVDIDMHIFDNVVKMSEAQYVEVSFTLHDAPIDYEALRSRPLQSLQLGNDENEIIPGIPGKTIRDMRQKIADQCQLPLNSIFAVFTKDPLQLSFKRVMPFRCPKLDASGKEEGEVEVCST